MGKMIGHIFSLCHLRYARYFALRASFALRAIFIVAYS
jgi:hypothetical protein